MDISVYFLSSSFAVVGTPSKSFPHSCNCMARLPITKSPTPPFSDSSSFHTKTSDKCSFSSGMTAVDDNVRTLDHSVEL